MGGKNSDDDDDDDDDIDDKKKRDNEKDNICPICFDKLDCPVRYNPSSNEPVNEQLRVCINKHRFCLRCFYVQPQFL